MEEGLLLEERLYLDKDFDHLRYEIASFIRFKDNRNETNFCFGLIPPLPTLELREKFSKKENAGVYLIENQLAILSAKHNACFTFGTVNLPEAELRELDNIVFLYKEQTKRLPEYLLSTHQRRFSLRYDCDYVNALLNMWRNTEFDNTHELFVENGTNPLFVRYQGMKVNTSDEKKEKFINWFLEQKEIVGTILLLPEYELKK